ncbi:alkene reductase [Mycolicibacterium chitae]|uniref:NADH:flavin oxidoreductase n=1 Tax=Mycolicibacterium chitae TaxID=1792 RepID=A0A448IB20_MYCCI|nr:alkene reductase [Mycolicibacterium chitae]MCV7108539.1 alkene reductase [Mycolicibacterium chitae]BBZ00771.1 alkene reductase [Mycolicibacterium chitae]VEG49619.1 NADH:flavin oxidoreductase [Mycolicibacterium chitae]
MTAPDLFSPATVGNRAIENRIWFAPCTRHRATIDEIPTPLMAQYYAQRAGAGVIVTEGVNPSPRGRGYDFVPAIYTDEHEAGWRPVTDAVHQRGGTIFMQLMHVGRLSFEEYQPAGAKPVAPSAIQPDPDFRGYTWTCPRPKRAFGQPRALTTAEIHEEIEWHAQAAVRAVRAGMDGIELHAASGYLVNQFLASSVNHRTDSYGGSVANRVRFLLEVVDAIVAAIGAHRTAVKLSPTFYFNDVRDDDWVATFSHAARELSSRGLAFLEVSDYGEYYSYQSETRAVGLMREHYDGFLVANGGYSRGTGADAVAAGHADAISYGALFIANPDLPERFRHGAPLTAPDPTTFYGPPTAQGYTDYPTWDPRAAVGADADSANLAADPSTFIPQADQRGS